MYDDPLDLADLTVDSFETQPSVGGSPSPGNPNDVAGKSGIPDDYTLRLYHTCEDCL